MAAAAARNSFMEDPLDGGAIRDMIVA